MVLHVGRDLPVAATPYLVVCREGLRRIERLAHHTTPSTDEVRHAHDR